MKLIFYKASDEINLMMATKMKGKLIQFKDSLTDLKIIKKEIGKTENRKRLEIGKIKDMTRK